MKLVISAALWFSLWGSFMSAAADVPGGARIVPQKLDDTLHMLFDVNGPGSNVGVLETTEGLILIDTSAGKLEAALSAIADRPVTHVINTHGHGDHSGGNVWFARRGAIIVRHGQSGRDAEGGQVLFQDQLTLHVGGQQVDIYAVRSHAPDDALIFLPGHNVLFMGDTFTTNWHPTFYSGGVAGQLAAIERALELADDRTVIVPGHGLASNRDGLLGYCRAFKAWVNQVRHLAAKGLSVEEMAADPGLRKIAGRFRQAPSDGPLPESAFRRFIERSISMDLRVPDGNGRP